MWANSGGACAPNHHPHTSGWILTLASFFPPTDAKTPCCYHISLLFLQPLKHFLIKQKQKQFPFWSHPPCKRSMNCFSLGKTATDKSRVGNQRRQTAKRRCMNTSGAGKLVYCCRRFGRWPAVICDSYKNLKKAGEFWDLPTRMIPDSKRISPHSQ